MYEITMKKITEAIEEARLNDSNFAADKAPVDLTGIGDFIDEDGYFDDYKFMFGDEA